ncbi:uncharacterized protein EV420DRAFT_147651 [Desarmillaria tabescens]|uniref:Uncharacterized protein n=1 Tax=Armillaria tabescens TaxID=1929756 RepID=A0AA39TKB8_ARMTA|nr:uncharacterized protein EV420DRAFT_147651 [Desarmillaria tabescens]KAK0462087.1 hypothetical protein EV420DRAFT_147651 [Desarmillaria tabescens]
MTLVYLSASSSLNSSHGATRTRQTQPSVAAVTWPPRCYSSIPTLADGSPETDRDTLKAKSKALRRKGKHGNFLISDAKILLFIHITLPSIPFLWGSRTDRAAMVGHAPFPRHDVHSMLPQPRTSYESRSMIKGAWPVGCRTINGRHLVHCLGLKRAHIPSILDR